MLFHDAVHAIPELFYSASELEAWAPTPPDFSHWESRLATKQPFVATDRHKIVGFIELESNGHIDCLYVHPQHQRQGVACNLLNFLVDAARSKGIDNLHVEASKVAMSFFKQHGFELLSENNVSLRGELLTNYNMQRVISLTNR